MRATIALTVAALAGCGGPSPPVASQTSRPAVSIAPDSPPPTDAGPVVVEQDDRWVGEAKLRPNGDGPLPITTRDPTRGPDGALVTVVVFSDYECPACAFFSEHVEQVRRSDPVPIRVVHKHYPLRSHPNARAAAEAATTVLVIGGAAAFWSYHQRLFSEQRMLSDERYRAWAAGLGIDEQRFGAVLAKDIVRAKVTEDRALGEKLGVNATPYVFVNCRALGDLEAVAELIAEERKSAGDAVASGVLRSHIYTQRCGANMKRLAP